MGDRWTLLIIESLLDGPLRFGDLVERIGIASNILSQRLKRLEQDAVVLAQPYSERPPRYEYELTASGRELAGALRLLADWGARHAEGVGAAPPRRLWDAPGGPLVLPDLRARRGRRRGDGRAPRMRPRSDRRVATPRRLRRRGSEDSPVGR